MKYLVMECHLSYAVVLDEEGRFLKVANQHYEVGQTISEIMEMEIPELGNSSSKKFAWKWAYTLTALAACFILFIPNLLTNTATFASVYMKINPEVRIDINEKDIVVGIEGVNQDGQDLIVSYHYKNKHLDLVMDELVDKAIEMGYLSSGGAITISLDAQDSEWVVIKSEDINQHLKEHLSEKLSVTIEVQNYKQTTIPVNPSESEYGTSDYGNIDSNQNSPNNNDSTYDEQTDYGTVDTDYGPNNDGVTDYIDTSTNEGSDGSSNYESDSSYEDSADDGDSSYNDSMYEE